MLYMVLFICVLILIVLYTIHSRYHGSAEYGKHIKFETDDEDFINLKKTINSYYDFPDELTYFMAKKGQKSYITHMNSESGNRLLRRGNFLQIDYIYKKWIDAENLTNMRGVKTVLEQIEKMRDQEFAHHRNILLCLNYEFDEKNTEPWESIEKIRGKRYDFLTGNNAALDIVIQGSFRLFRPLLLARSLRRIVCKEIEENDETFAKINNIIYGGKQVILKNNWEEMYEKYEKIHPYENNNDHIKKFSMMYIINNMMAKNEFNPDSRNFITQHNLLHIACIKNEPKEFVEFLLKHSMSGYENQKDVYGYIPLHYITNYNKTKSKKIMEECGYTDFVFCEDYNFAADFDYDAEQNKQDIIKLLKTDGEKLLETDIIKDKNAEFFLKTKD